MARTQEDPAELALLQSLREGLRSDEPIHLLFQVSGMLAATSPRTGPFEKKEEGPTQSDLVASFLGTSYAETTAALHVIRAFGADEVMDARIGRELAQRRQPMPSWLTRLAEAEPDPEVWFFKSALRDVDDYLFEVRLPSGHGLTAAVLVDNNNSGGVVTNAYVLSTSLDEVVALMRGIADVEKATLTPTDPATARAIIEDAIRTTMLLFPPVESETWPACRPMVEWMLRLLPEGGVRPERPEWSDEQRAELAGDFFTSPFGVNLDDADHRLLLESVLTYAIDYGVGDPLLWSEIRVETLLLDWFPRKVVAEPSFLTKLPELLRAYISYAHDRSGVSDDLTAEPLLALEDLAPDYQRLIRTERLQGPEALMARMIDGSIQSAAGDDLDLMDDPWDSEDPMAGMSLSEVRQRLGLITLENLAGSVGGHYQLRNLGVTPLPDEPFEWAGIADDIRPTVTEILNHCDRCADELLDVEHRTAMRRFLGRAAVVDPAPFRRKASPARLAAAVAWVIGRANNTVGNYGSGLSVGDLMAWFGVKGTASQRAEPLLVANGVEPAGFSYDPVLGTADLLVSSRRANLIAQRDRWLQELQPDGAAEEKDPT